MTGKAEMPDISSRAFTASELAAMVEQNLPEGVYDLALNGEVWNQQVTPAGTSVLVPEELWDGMEILAEWSLTTPPSGAPVTWDTGETIGRFGSLYVYVRTGDSDPETIVVGRFDDELQGLQAAAAEAEFLSVENGELVAHPPTPDWASDT